MRTYLGRQINIRRYVKRGFSSYSNWALNDANETPYSVSEGEERGLYGAWEQASNETVKDPLSDLHHEVNSA